MSVGPKSVAFLWSSSAHPRDLHSFPTRRSSDLTVVVSSRRSYFPGWPTSPPAMKNGFWKSFRSTVTTGLFRSEEHTSELQSLTNLVCRLLLEKKKDVAGMLLEFLLGQFKAFALA